MRMMERQLLVLLHHVYGHSWISCQELLPNKKAKTWSERSQHKEKQSQTKEGVSSGLSERMLVEESKAARNREQSASFTVSSSVLTLLLWAEADDCSHSVSLQCQREEVVSLNIYSSKKSISFTSSSRLSSQMTRGYTLRSNKSLITFPSESNLQEDFDQQFNFWSQGSPSGRLLIVPWDYTPSFLSKVPWNGISECDDFYGIWIWRPTSFSDIISISDFILDFVFTLTISFIHGGDYDHCCC